MEARVKRRVPVTFPAALLPVLALLLALGSVGSGVGSVAVLRLLWLSARKVAEIPRKLSRRISREFSDRLLAEISQRRKLRPLHLVGGVGALLLLRAVQRAVAVLRDSLALMNPCETQLDPELEAQRQAIIQNPAWGEGLPRPPSPGTWRPFLHNKKDAQENLEEIYGALGIVARQPQEMTLDQLVEGVRRVLIVKHPRVVCLTGRYWSKEQANSIAEALATECGLPTPLSRGGLEECSPFRLPVNVPWHPPRWLQQAQCLGIAVLRPLFLHAWSWTSRYVETPFGPMHVYDARPAANALGDKEEPPLLLQHGMFVTGWSMALLGLLLVQRGRRVILPDLFDFDHGLSASCGDSKIRRPVYSVEALVCVVRSILEGGASELDIAGHSFGGWLIGALASRCRHEGLPVRKVVMLGPGGIYNILNHSPMMARLLNNPTETVNASVPWWIPAAPARKVVGLLLGVLLSPNNSNLLFGMDYSEYLGSDHVGSDRPTLLLWGDKDNVAFPRRPEFLGPFVRTHFPRVEGHWVRGGGHNIQLDSAVAVARAMDVWLRGGTQGMGSIIEKLLFMLDRPLRPMVLPGEVLPQGLPHARL